MVQITYYVAASLDGFIAKEDGNVDWLDAVRVEGQDYGYRDFYARVDALLMGRRTYDQIRSFGDWPYKDKPCTVFSRDRELEPDAPAEFSTENPREVLDRLERRGHAHAWLVGGANLAGSFFDRGLISDFVVTLIPTLLGSGLPMLGPSGTSRRLELVERAEYPNGVVQLHYRPLDG